MNEILKLKNIEKELIYESNGKFYFSERFYLHEKLTKERYKQYNIYIWDCDYYVEGVFSYCYEGFCTKPYVITFSLYKNNYAYIHFFSSYEEAIRAIPEVKNKINEFINKFETMSIE